LLDRRLLEFLAGLPAEQFVNEKWSRWLIRRASAGILPHDVCWQAKAIERARGEETLSVARQALNLLRQALESASAPPEGCRYFNIPRLLKRLQPESLQRDRLGYLLRVAQFLDF
jgi:asparagine synthase (glutamine-hydrolysing)